MIEWILAILMTPIALVCLVILSLLTEHNQKPLLTSVLMVAAILIAYHMFDPTLSVLVAIAGAWIPVGLLWSWFKFSVQCKKASDSYESGTLPKSKVFVLIDPTQNKGRIFYWVWAWPISISETSLHGVLSGMQEFIANVCGQMFNRISQKALNRIDEIDKKKQ